MLNKKKKIINQNIYNTIILQYTTKPINTEHSQSLQFCSLLKWGTELNKKIKNIKIYQKYDTLMLYVGRYLYYLYVYNIINYKQYHLK